MKFTKQSVLTVALSVLMMSFANAADMKMEKGTSGGMEQSGGASLHQGQDSKKSEEVHRTTGVVKKVNKEKGTVTLSHAPVKSLNWSAMTMAFQVKDPALFEKLAVGNTVEFEFVKDGKSYHMISAK